jgi:hypothetical protein
MAYSQARERIINIARITCKPHNLQEYTDIISWFKFIFPSHPFRNRKMSDLIHIKLNGQAFLLLWVTVECFETIFVTRRPYIDARSLCYLLELMRWSIRSPTRGDGVHISAGPWCVCWINLPPALSQGKIYCTTLPAWLLARSMIQAVTSLLGTRGHRDHT